MIHACLAKQSGAQITDQKVGLNNLYPILALVAEEVNVNALGKCFRRPVEAPRPGHADLAGCMKYGHRDGRAVLERASARETAARVAAGAVARQVLSQFGIEVFAHVLEVGGIPSPAPDPTRLWAQNFEQRHQLRAASAFHGLDPALEGDWIARVDQAKKDGDSLGGIFEVRALGLPPGLGS